MRPFGDAVGFSDLAMVASRPCTCESRCGGFGVSFFAMAGAFGGEARTRRAVELNAENKRERCARTAHESGAAT